MHKQLLTDFNSVFYKSSKKIISIITSSFVIIDENTVQIYKANIQILWTLIYCILSKVHCILILAVYIGPLLWIICLCIRTVKAIQKPFYKVKLRRRINRIPIYKSTFSQLNLGRVLTTYHADKVLTSFRLSNRRHRQLMKRRKKHQMKLTSSVDTEMRLPLLKISSLKLY